VYPQNVGDPINDKMGGFIVFTGGLTGLDMPTLEVEGWTGTGTGPVVTSMMTGGLLGIDDVQLFNLVRPAVGTTFTATLNGQTTAAIGAYNNPSGPDQGVALQAALEALPTIGPGNVLVQAQNQTSSHSVDGFYVQFIGSLAQKRQNLLQITPTPSTGVSIVRLTEACFANSSSIAPIPHGLSDTIQIYGPTNFNLQGSHFSMQFVLGGSTSPTVTNVPMTPNALQLILESLPSVGPGNVAVYGQSEYPNQESNIFVIHFTGDLAGTDVPLLQAQSSLPGNSLVAECRVVQHGGMTTSDDFQWVDFRIPTGQPFGNNTITYGGHTTVNIPIGSTGTPTVDGLGPQIRTAMQALSSIGFGNCQIYAGEYPTSSFQFTDGFLARFTGCLSGTPALAITATTYAGPGALITRIVPGFGGSSPDANPVSLYPIAAWPSGAFVSNDVNVTLNRFVSGTLFPSPPADTFDLLGPVGGGSCGVVAANITKTPDAVTSISFSMYYALGCLPTAFISASHVTAVFGVCNYIYTWTISVEVETSPGVYTAIWSVSGIVPPNTNPGVLTYPMTLINPSLNTRPNWQNARLNLSATGTSVPSSTETEVYQAYVKVYY
jgi:hypothetical protein